MIENFLNSIKKNPKSIKIGRKVNQNSTSQADDKTYLIHNSATSIRVRKTDFFFLFPHYFSVE